MGPEIQSRWLSAVGILGLALMGFGSCSGAETASEDVRPDGQASDIPGPDDSQAIERHLHPLASRIPELIREADVVLADETPPGMQ